MHQRKSKLNVKTYEKVTCNCNQVNLTRFFQRREAALSQHGVLSFQADPKSLTPYIDKRKWMFKTQTVPTITSLTNRWGKDFAEILLNQMTPLEKRLIGTHAPLKGPPGELWIDPHSQLKGKVEVTVLPDEKYLKVLSHDGVLQLCTDIEKKLEQYQKFMVQVTVEEAVAYERMMAKKEWDKILEENERAHQECMTKLHNLVQAEHEMREQVLKEVYDVLREALQKTLIEKHTEESRRVIIDSTQQLRGELVNYYEEKYKVCLERNLRDVAKGFEDEYKRFAHNYQAVIKEERKVAKKEYKNSLEYQNKLKCKNLEKALKMLETACRASKLLKTTLKNPRLETNFHTLEDKLKKFSILFSAETSDFSECEDLMIGMMLEKVSGLKNNQKIETEVSSSTKTTTHSDSSLSRFEEESEEVDSERGTFIAPNKVPKRISWESETDSSQSSFERLRSKNAFNLKPSLLTQSILKSINQDNRCQTFLQNFLRLTKFEQDQLEQELAKNSKNLILNIVNDKYLSDNISIALDAFPIPTQTQETNGEKLHCSSCWFKLLSAQDSVQLVTDRHTCSMKIHTEHEIDSENSSNESLKRKGSISSESLNVNMSENEDEEDEEDQLPILDSLDRVLEMKEELEQLIKRKPRL